MILGITDDETVMMDFDETTFKTACYWAIRAMHWHKLGGLLIAKSSINNYHLIFNKRVTWSENMKIVAWVALLSHNEKLAKWLLMQCIKQASTLRVSPKGDKPPPRIVHREGEQGEMIAEYLDYRKTVKKIWRALPGSQVSSNSPTSPLGGVLPQKGQPR